MSTISSNYQTGPRTAAGKERSSRNAVQHGLTAKRIVVREEDRAEYEEIRSQLFAQVRPQGALQEITFNQLLHAAWNLERIQRIEEEIFATSANPFADEATAKQLAHLTRYQTTHQRAYYRALKELKALQTNALIQGTLQDEPTPLTDTLSVHIAKRKETEAWSGPADTPFHRLVMPPPPAKAPQQEDSPSNM